MAVMTSNADHNIHSLLRDSIMSCWGREGDQQAFYAAQDFARELVHEFTRRGFYVKVEPYRGSVKSWRRGSEGKAGAEVIRRKPRDTRLQDGKGGRDSS